MHPVLVTGPPAVALSTPSTCPIVTKAVTAPSPAAAALFGRPA